MPQVGSVILSTQQYELHILNRYLLHSKEINPCRTNLALWRIINILAEDWCNWLIYTNAFLFKASKFSATLVICIRVLRFQIILFVLRSNYLAGIYIVVYINIRHLLTGHTTKVSCKKEIKISVITVRVYSSRLIKAALKVTEKKLLGERVEQTVITIASLAKTTHESCVWSNNEE